MRKRLNIGDYIPDFTLKNQDDQDFVFTKENLENNTIIFFYPKDNSLVCNRQACAFNEHFNELKNLSVQVIGINSGTVESHNQFYQSQQLKFQLLSDVDNKVLKLFGLSKCLFFTARVTFVINKKGLIVFKYSNFFRGRSHLKKVLSFLNLNKL